MGLFGLCVIMAMGPSPFRPTIQPLTYPPLHPPTPNTTQQNGGRSNAYTDMNDTVYFFDLNWDKLEGGCVFL